MMSRYRGKRYRQSLEKAPKGKLPLAQAVAAVKEFKPTKFDPTVDLVVHLGIDPKQSDQTIRGALSLPHGIGKSKKVVAFCDGEDIQKAKAAGAIEAGSDELIKKINDGWTDFDVAVATPPMMKSVSRLGRILGPQGKMPSPKAGTVVADIAQAVKEYAAGKVEFRNDDGGNLHVVIGKQSFDAKALTENAEAVLSHIKRVRPASAKGVYIKRASISATMSPAVDIDVQ
jgi:large subunit ribosomal protein L1